MILATQSGWLIAVKLIRETPNAWIVKARDEKWERRVSKNDDRQCVFNNTDEAIAWQEGDA